jgi:hypothetical protein
VEDSCVAAVDTYKLAMSPLQRGFVFGMQVLMSLIGVGMLLALLLGGSSEWSALVVMAPVWCGITIWNWHVLLLMPYEIHFLSPTQISFVALGGTTTLSASEIYSLKLYRGGGGFYTLRHEAGELRLFSQFTGFHEVVSRIKAANPRFEVVGA